MLRSGTSAHLTGLFVVCAFCAGPGRAQSDLEDRYWIEGSAYWAAVNSTASVASRNFDTIATEIDFESDLDLADSRALPSVSVGARLGGGWVVGADYYSLRRTGSRAISRDITFDDVTYPASAQVSSAFNSDVYRLTVGHTFISRDNFELGGALGLHATNFEVSLTGQAQVGNAGVQTQVRRRQILAPVPTVGLFTTWEVAPRLTLSGRIDYLSLKIGDYDGRLVNTQAELGYRVAKAFGLGVMYRHVDYRVIVDKPEWQGMVRYRFSGPAVFARVGF